MSTRKEVLEEALKAVKSERLCGHKRFLKGGCDPSDEAYSCAIRDAENAIKALIDGKPAMYREHKGDK